MKIKYILIFKQIIVSILFVTCESNSRTNTTDSKKTQDSLTFEVISKAESEYANAFFEGNTDICK
jgi:hypothetical protein